MQLTERPRHQENPAPLLRLAILVFAAASLSVATLGAGSSEAVPAQPTEIVQRMVQQNQLRAQHLKYFTSRRHYHVEFHGLGSYMAADMHVQATYTAGTGKTFHVIDESGSHVLLNHVLKKLLQTEQDDSRQQTSALTPANYNFVFQKEANENGRQLYVFTVEPRSKNKLLYRGTIWIDAGDYAVVRVEAQPAENPSFWIKGTEIHHDYTKNGEFWLPQTTRSETKVRLGGTAALTIDYGTYDFEKPHEVTPSESTDLARYEGLASAR
jgi:hypothetical protein